MTDLATLFSLFVVFISLVLVFVLYRNRKLPPGPYGLPFFGYYPFLDVRAYITLFDLAKYYKSDVISFRTIGGDLITVLNGFSVIKEVLLSRSEEFIGRPSQANIVEWLDNGLGIAQAEGLAWKEQRRFYLHAVKDFGVGKVELEDRIHEEIKLTLNDIKELQGKPFNPKEYVFVAVANVVHHILFNKRFKRGDSDFKKFIEGFDFTVQCFAGKEIFVTGIAFKLMMMFTKSGRKAEEGKKFLNKKIANLVDNEVITFDSHHTRHFIDAYWKNMIQLGEKGELQGSSFSRRRFIAVVLNILLEGMESVGSAIVSLLLLLGKHPESQKKAQKEIDDVIGFERTVTWKDKQNLPYTDALLLELYRHAQPFFTSTLYSNFEETTVRGYRIPKRSITVANLWSINFDPKVFEDPEKFDPNRFLDQEGKRVKKDGPFPFGLGKRSCVGESLAQVEVFLFMTDVLQNFTIETVSEHKLRLLPREKLKTVL